MATNNTFKENALRVVAVVGLIAVLLLGAWGIIQLAFVLPSFFSNIGGLGAKESLSVSVPPSVNTGAIFPLSWSHTNKNKDAAYSYSVSYSCASGFAMAAPLPTGAFQIVPCDKTFNYLNATSTTPLVGVLSAGAKQASTVITVAATKLSDGTVSVKGTGSLTVNATSTQGTAVAPGTTGAPKPSTATSYTPPTTSKPKTSTKPASTYVASGRTTNLYGYPDLAVQVLSSPASAPVGSRIQLQFVITNIGTNAAAAGWSFTAALPYNPVYTFNSGAQQKLYPGDKIIYTLSYDAVAAAGCAYPTTYGTTGYGPCGGNTYPTLPSYPPGYGSGSCNAFGPCTVPGYTNSYNVSSNTYQSYGNAQATITADPYNYLQESSKANNAASVSYVVY